jgi:hypothetical protein
MREEIRTGGSMVLILGLSFLLVVSGCIRRTQNVHSPTMIQGPPLIHDPLQRYELKTGEEVKRGISEDHDAYKKITMIHGPLIRVGNEEMVAISHSYPVRYKDKTRLFALILFSHESEPSYFDEAYDTAGDRFNVSINHQGRLIVYSIPVSEEYLHNHLDTGLEMKLYGKREFVLTLPGFYIKAFLDYVNQAHPFQQL